jgi:hypothetical protein
MARKTKTLVAYVTEKEHKEVEEFVPASDFESIGHMIRRLVFDHMKGKESKK